MTRPTDLGFLDTPCHTSGKTTTLDGVGEIAHGVPQSGHYWHQTHPDGQDPEFSMDEWEERKAEQAAKLSASAEPVG